jgi:hypothetical protein
LRIRKSWFEWDIIVRFEYSCYGLATLKRLGCVTATSTGRDISEWCAFSFVPVRFSFLNAFIVIKICPYLIICFYYSDRIPFRKSAFSSSFHSNSWNRFISIINLNSILNNNRTLLNFMIVAMMVYVNLNHSYWFM